MSSNRSYLTCDYDDEPAVDRVRWTVYGGAFKYHLVCERHRDRVRGQRGVDLVGLPGEAMGRAIASAEDRQIERDILGRDPDGTHLKGK